LIKGLTIPSFLRKQEPRVPGGNQDPVFKMVPGFRRDDVWTPVFTGVTNGEVFSVIPANAGIQ
jgi:hypothetical protein